MKKDGVPSETNSLAFDEMASYKVSISGVHELRLFFATYTYSPIASWIESATNGRVDWAWDIPTKYDSLPFDSRIGNWNRRYESHGIGVKWLMKELCCLC